MKRVILKIGIVDEPANPLALQASARDQEMPGRWFNARLSLSTILQALILAGSLVTGYVTLKVQQADQAKDIADLRERVHNLNSRLTDKYVESKTFDDHNEQVNKAVTAVLETQQQILSVLLDSPKGTPTP